MNEGIPLTVIAFKTATLAIGGLITYLAAKAARKTGLRGMTYLALGFAVVTFGSILAGVADQLLVVSDHDALIVENALTTVGFAIIAYSLYVTRRR
jgi:hypothetical protein